MVPDFFDHWLTSRLPETATLWLRQQCGNDQEARFFLAFSACARHCRGSFTPSQAELGEAQQVCHDWQPVCWTLTDLARARLLLARCAHGTAPASLLADLASTADLGENLSLYRSLCLLPQPDTLQERASEGLRSNVIDVFEAVACDNPYPHDHLSQAAWNQMILKAFFIGCDVDRIVGLRQRGNPELHRMLQQYADERRAANRDIDPRLFHLMDT
jgi:hypothetical protein